MLVMKELILIFQFLVLYSALVVHEVCHGLMAYRLGDPTAKAAGRLSFNPLKHIDPFGSVILPLLLLLFRSPFIVGYAKPVPFNPANFRNIKRDTCLVALAGPLANIFLGLIFILLTWLFYFVKLISPYSPLFTLFLLIIRLNFIWGFFNLLGPFPPFDGSHLVINLLSDRFNDLKLFLLRNGLILSVIYIFFYFPIIYPPYKLFNYSFIAILNLKK